MIRVKDIMTTGVITVGVTDPVIKVIREMASGRFMHMPVMERNVVVGVVSGRDIRIAIDSPVIYRKETFDDPSLDNIEVESFMTHSPVVIDPDADILEAVRLMENVKIGCLPVVRDGLLEGIITRGDLVRCLVDILGNDSNSSR